jgi:hypothetical protein
MRVMAIAGVLLLGLGGCAKSEPGAKAGGAAATGAAPATPPEVHFTARDFAFQGPDTISSGMTTIVLHNDGPSLHNLMLVRLDSSKTVEDLKAAYAALQPGLDMPPAWAVPSGGVNPPMPGSDTRATLMIEPGNYAVVCVVDVPDHELHVDKGMIKGLTVVPSATPSAPAPTSDMTVTEVDFAFAPSGAFTAGHHVVKVVNNGSQPHEMEVIQLAPGKTMDDLAKWGQTYAGPLPGISLGGAAPMSPGQVEYVPFDFTAGNYAILCFVVDPASHMPHLAKGMVLPFTIS